CCTGPHIKDTAAVLKVANEGWVVSGVPCATLTTRGRNNDVQHCGRALANQLEFLWRSVVRFSIVIVFAQVFRCRSIHSSSGIGQLSSANRNTAAIKAKHFLGILGMSTPISRCSGR